MLKRVLHAFVAFCFGQGIATLGYLLLVPLYLHVWSASLYGEWLTLGSVVAYLSCLHLGVQTWAVNRLTQAYARGDMEEYRRVRDTAFAFYFFLALFGLYSPVAALASTLGRGAARGQAFRPVADSPTTDRPAPPAQPARPASPRACIQAGSTASTPRRWVARVSAT